MPLLPARLPLWAYVAAGGAAFAATRLMHASDPGAGPADPNAAASSTTPDAGTSDLWGSFADQTGAFGGTGQIGYLPQVTIPGETTVSDQLGGQTITPGRTTIPGRAVTPSAPATPTPTTTTVSRPTATPPSNAAGWVYLKAGQVLAYDPAGSWNGKYPVNVKTGRAIGSAGARWVGSPQTAILPNGAKVTVRRVTNVGSSTWLNAWITSSGYAVNSPGTATAKV